MTPLQSTFTIQSQTRVLYMGNSFFGKAASRIYNSKHTSHFSTIGSTTELIPALSRWCRSSLLHQFSSLTINFPLTHLSHCAAQPWWVFPLAQIVCGLPPSRSHHLTLLLSDSLSLTAFSSSLSSGWSVHRRKMQKLFIPMLDLHPFCFRLFNIKRNVYTRFTRPFSSSNNNSRQRNSTGGHYKVLSFNFRMTLRYYATCFSLRLDQLPSARILLRTPLSIYQLSLSLNLTLTLLQMHSRSPALMNHQFVVLSRGALWDHPERKQTTLRALTFSLHTTHGKHLQLRRGTSHQKFLSS